MNSALNNNRCFNYVGVSCVNGSCPKALAEKYSDYSYVHYNCDNCIHYKGCEDCMFRSANGDCDYWKDEE